MAANSFPFQFKSLELDFGTSVAQALWVKAAENLNFLDGAYPIGMLLFFYATQPQLPTTMQPASTNGTVPPTVSVSALPDSRYWQLCDGSVVSNPVSPLNGVTLPDMRGIFFRHPTTGETPLTTGGSPTVGPFTHNHGGMTGVTNPRWEFQMEDGGDREEAQDHAHSISSDLGGIFTTIPPYVDLQIYIRIA